MPQITLAGPLGSGLSKGAEQAPTWAGLSLEQQQAARRDLLAQHAIDLETQDRQRQLANEQAMSQAMGGLQGLPQQAEQDHNMTQLGASMATAMGGQTGPVPSTRDLYTKGAQKILADFSTRGDPQGMHALIQDSLAIESKLADQESRDMLRQGLQEHLQANPDAAQTLGPLLPYLDDPNTDPEKLLGLITHANEQQLRTQTKAAEQQTKFATAQGRLADTLSPEGNFAAFTKGMPYQDVMALREAIVSSSTREIARIGLPDPEQLPSAQVRQEREQALGQMQYVPPPFQQIQGEVRNKRARKAMGAQTPAPAQTEPAAQPMPDPPPLAEGRKKMTEAGSGPSEKLAPAFDAVEKLEASGKLTEEGYAKAMQDAGLDPNDPRIMKIVADFLSAKQGKRERMRGGLASARAQMDSVAGAAQ